VNLYKKIPFAQQGTDYEIRVLYDERAVTVAAFRDNRPANGFRYQVLIPKACDARALLDRHAARELVDRCRDDIEQGRWEPVAEAIGFCAAGKSG